MRSELPCVFLRGRPVFCGNDDRHHTPERRQARFLARRNFAVVKRIAVASEQCFHNRMLRLISLEQTSPADVLAPRPANDLMQKLERTLRRARIAVVHAEIGVDDADERKTRKVMTFRYKLRADDDIDVA